MTQAGFDETQLPLALPGYEEETPARPFPIPRLRTYHSPASNTFDRVVSITSPHLDNAG